jgi:hypothetical protein
MSEAAIREANRRRAQEVRDKREEAERLEQCEQAVRFFEEALYLANTTASEARWQGRAFDPGPFVPDLAARLTDALNTLHTNGLLSRLDALDREQTVNHHNRQGEFGERELATQAFDHAKGSLQQVAAGRLAAEQAVRALWFDPELWPVGRWASLLLRMVFNDILIDYQAPGGAGQGEGGKPGEKAALDGRVQDNEPDGPLPNGQRGGIGSRKRKGGRPPLEKSNPRKSSIYSRIQREHAAGVRRKDIVTLLKDDKDFMDAVKEARLTFSLKLVKNALAYYLSQRKKQETPAT